MPVFVIRMLLVSLLLVPMFVSKTSAESPVVPLSQKPRVMNNFVVQLLDVKDLPGDRRQAFRFESPRDGWLFFRVTAGVDDVGQSVLDFAERKLVTHEVGERFRVCGDALEERCREGPADAAVLVFFEGAEDS